VPRFAEPDALLIAADRNPNTTGAKLILGTEDPYAKLASIHDGVRSGAIKALIVLGEDLIADSGFHYSDLANLDFLLQSNILANHTALAAHIVDWEILAALLRAAGGRSFHDLDQVFHALSQECEPFAGLNLDRIGDLGIPLVTRVEATPANA